MPCQPRGPCVLLVGLLGGFFSYPSFLIGRDLGRDVQGSVSFHTCIANDLVKPLTPAGEDLHR